MLSMAVSHDVPRVKMSRGGLFSLAGLAARGQPMSAELADYSGSLCGRARKVPDPASPAYSDGHSWHVQVGGHLLGGEWAGTPMGCGCGASPYEAAVAARDDLIRRGNELLRQAERISAMIGGRT